MSVIKSEKIFTPQEYLELVTGKTYVISSDNDVEAVELILEKEGYDFWTYTFTEIEHVIDNEVPVVLVDYMIYNEDTKEFEHVLRWSEVSEN